MRLALAWVAGMLVPIAPAGGGVREIVLVAALSPVASRSVALIVALVSRVLMMLADLALAAWTGFLGRRPNAGLEPSEPLGEQVMGPGNR